MKGAESGVVAGVLGTVLLGAIISVLALPVSALTKLGYIIYDMGIVGLSFALLSEAIGEEKSEIMRVGFAIAGVIALLLLKI
ncbi:hypothetical membrane protein [Thermococcus chitonophagus]|uniref:Hypothetical membrane protein n=1 Tax=Thermococcus chitonophagus TaxID=54262 RepID=A0A161KA50_9EURY|nr:hypothetical membrane protein [Thermococcus chitonophagus]